MMGSCVCVHIIKYKWIGYRQIDSSVPYLLVYIQYNIQCRGLE